MTVLIVINDPPYGSERAYNALRLAQALMDQGVLDLRVFLMADGVGCAKAGQKVPVGYYDIQRMLQGLAARDARVALCTTCMDARGLSDADLVPGAVRSSMNELATWTLEATRAMVF